MNKPFTRCIIDCSTTQEKEALIEALKDKADINSAFFSLKKDTFAFILFDEEQRILGQVGMYVARQLAEEGYPHFSSVKEFLEHYHQDN